MIPLLDPSVETLADYGEGRRCGCATARTACACWPGRAAGRTASLGVAGVGERVLSNETGEGWVLEIQGPGEAHVRHPGGARVAARRRLSPVRRLERCPRPDPGRGMELRRGNRRAGDAPRRPQRARRRAAILLATVAAGNAGRGRSTIGAMSREGEDLRTDPPRGRRPRGRERRMGDRDDLPPGEPAPRGRRDARRRSRPPTGAAARSSGVFVNAPLDDVLATLGSVPLTMLQFHGDEGPSYCAEAARRSGLKVMKAVRAKDAHAVRALSAYKTDFHMLDAYVPGTYGGTGERFDWELAAAHPGGPPLVLSGGLTAGERRRGAGGRAAVRGRRRERRGGRRPASRTPTAAALLRGRRERGRRAPALMATERRAALRPLRRPLRAGDADARARRARAGVGRGARRPGASARGSTRLLATYVGRPTPLYHAERLSERAGATRLPEARGPAPHRRAQDQQRARARRCWPSGWASDA